MAATLTSTKTGTNGKPKKREKRVFKDSSEVAHVWAQQIQPYGCNPSRNIYFESQTIFSYGSHFAMARFAGRGIVLVTNRTYSVTTGGHQRDVENALRGLPIQKIFVRDVEHYANEKENLRLLWQELHDTAKAHGKARREDYRGTMRSQIENLAAYAKFIKFGRTKELAALVESAKTNPQFWAPLAKYSERAALETDTAKSERQKRLEQQREERYARERARRERQTELDKAIRPIAIAAQRSGQLTFHIPADVAAQFSDCLSDNEKSKAHSTDSYLRTAIERARREQWADIETAFEPLAIAAWRQGSDTFTIPAELVERFTDCLSVDEKQNGCRVSQFVSWNSPTMLRIDGSDIETSRGARVPIRAAKIAWPALKSHQVPPERIGMYSATEFADGILTIGCHRIPVAEMNRIAAELGLEGEIAA